jgi:hypothetical protein
MTYDELGNLIKKGPDEPEGKADGGIIGRRQMFLGGFLSKLINSNPQIISAIKAQQTPSDIPLTLQERYRKYLLESENTPTNNSPKPLGLIENFIRGSGIATPQGGSISNDVLYNLYRKNLEGKADGGRIGYAKGKRVKSSVDKLLEKLNTKLSKKTSMESVDPKTGEVTVPKKPIRRAEEPTGVTVMDPEPEIVDERSITKNKSRQLTQDEIADYEELMGRDSEQWMSEGTVEEAEKALKRSKAEEAYYRTQYKLGKLDPSPGEQTEARMKFLQKKLEEAELTKDRRLITPNEINELDDLENIFEKDLTQTNEQALENEMNRVLNQYDKSMFIKDAQGLVDVSNPANAEKMALLLKRDHPEIYNKIFKLTEDINQKQVLDEFDITDREPNAKGGIAGLL